MAITLNPNAIYNPPSVTPTPTPSDIGLGNVDNTSDLNKPISLATQNALNSKADLLNGKVKTEQLQGCEFTYDATNAIITLVDPIGQSFEIDLPIENLFQAANYDETTKTLKLNTVGGGEIDISLADLVDLPEITLATSNPAAVPTTGKKVYFNTSTGKVWFNVNNAWVGGYNTLTDTEKANYTVAYTHSQTTGNPHGTTKSDIGLGNVDNTADANKNVATAVKLATARTLSYTGDVTGSNTFDGSGAVSFAMTLASSGVTAGNYGSSSVTAGTAPTFPYLTINAKGLITGGTTVTLGDAASYSVGTSGTKVPLLSGVNTWGAVNYFSATLRASQYFEIGNGNSLAGNRVISFYAAGDTSLSGQISVVNTTMTLTASAVTVSNTLTVTNALSAGSLSLTTALPITSGGTGSKTAADARVALGIQDTVLSSFTTTTGTVSTTDTIVTAVSKINGNLGTVDTALTEILGG